jgi:hypothetical protein
MEKLVKFEVPHFTTLEEAVSFGLDIVEVLNRLQWLTGDYALAVERDLGSGALEEVARAIGSDIKSLRRCRDVASRYTPKEREMFPKLSWSHYRAAAGVKDRAERIKWLRLADDEGWSCELLSVKINQGDLAEEVMPRLVQCVVCRKWYPVGPNICFTAGHHDELIESQRSLP